MTNRRTTATNDKALAAFVAAKAEIDARLERLKCLSDDHFHADPDEIHWGHVGDLQRYVNLLRQMKDIAFSEAEFAD
ncbi:MAG: hypothetical protein ABI832_14400 [bacterium]